MVLPEKMQENSENFFGGSLCMDTALENEQPFPQQILNFGTGYTYSLTHTHSQFLDYGLVWSSKVTYSPVWSLMVPYGPLWSRIVP